jgi:hypothetical protein
MFPRLFYFLLLVWAGIFAMSSTAPAGAPQPPATLRAAPATSGSNAILEPISLHSANIDSNEFLAPMKPDPKAGPPIQLDVTVEVYEFTKLQAFSVQKAFAEGTDSERKTILLKIRDGWYPGSVTSVAFGERSCETGQTSEVSSIQEYRYPTEFNDDKSGMAIPTGFETRNLGTMMLLNVSPPGEDGGYLAGVQINTVGLESTAHYSASKADSQGSITQPIFTTERIITNLRLTPGVPKLVGAYAPFSDDTVKSVLRLVFVTIQPDR